MDNQPSSVIESRYCDAGQRSAFLGSVEFGISYVSLVFVNGQTIVNDVLTKVTGACQSALSEKLSKDLKNEALESHGP